MGRNSKSVTELRRALSKNSDRETSQGASAYMRDQFKFFGVKTPHRRQLTKTLISNSQALSEKELISLCRELWLQNEREFQYVACDLLIKNAKRLSKNFVLNEAKWFITHKSWWDTVDAIRTAIEIVIDQYPELRKETDKWIKSKNIWLIRVAIIHQLKLGKRTDSVRLEKYCAMQAKNTNFFVAKAIGWALRSYSYTDPKFVKRFIKGHPELQPLTVREGLKAINRLVK